MERVETLKSSMVVSISILGASLCAYLLYYDVYVRKAFTDGLELAGTLSEKTQSVRRKLGDQMIWDSIDSNESLYWNDSVQTAERASAKITLKEGGEIALGESSLVVLERDNDKLALKLKSGQLLVDSKDKTSGIKINGVDISKTSGDQLSLQVDEKKGALTATSSSADGSAKQLIIDAQGKVQEREMVVALRGPAPMAHVYTQQAEHSMTFEWTPKTTQEKRVFELASDKDFRKIVDSRELSKDKLTLNMKPGFYYWRVKMKEKGEYQFSETRSLDVVFMENPKLLSPEPGKKIGFRGPLPILEFSWKANNSVSKYGLEISSDSGFQNKIFSGETSQTSLRTSKVAEGPLFWRVTAYYGKEVRHSEPAQLELVRLKDSHPPALDFPVGDYKVDYEFYQKYGGLPFRWKVEPEETYRFVLSQSKNLANEIVSFETKQGETLVTERLAEGDYYWTVEYKGNADEWTHTEVRKISVTPLIPPLEPPTLLDPAQNLEMDLLKTKVVRWTWSTVEGAKSYKFKLLRYDGEDVKIVAEENIRSIEHSVKDLPDGRYKWSVSSIDQYGREGRPMEQNFQVVHGYQLEAPSFQMEEVQ